MKHTLIALLFLSLLTLGSCEKGGDSLDGTWQLSDLEGSGSSYLSIINGEAIPVLFAMEGCDLDYLVTFAEDELTFTTEGKYSIKYNSQLINDTTVHTVIHDDHVITSTYSEVESEIVSDRTIIEFQIPTPVGEQVVEMTTVTIIERTEDVLVLSHEKSTSADIPAGSLFSMVNVMTIWRKK